MNLKVFFESTKGTSCEHDHMWNFFKHFPYHPWSYFSIVSESFALTYNEFWLFFTPYSPVIPSLSHWKPFSPAWLRTHFDHLKLHTPSLMVAGPENKVIRSQLSVLTACCGFHTTFYCVCPCGAPSRRGLSFFRVLPSLLSTLVLLAAGYDIQGSYFSFMSLCDVQRLLMLVVKPGGCVRDTPTTSPRSFYSQWALCLSTNAFLTLFTWQHMSIRGPEP